MAKPRSNPAEILVFGNPAKRKTKKKKAKSKRHFSAAQLANQRRFAAQSRARSKRGGAHRASSVRHNPASSMTLYSPSRPRAQSRRSSSSDLTQALIDAAIRGGVGAGGALSVDIAYGYAQDKLPDGIKMPITTEGGVNYLYYAVKCGLALGAALLGGKIAPRHWDKYIAAAADGALAVNFHEAARTQLMLSGTSLPLGRLNPGKIASGPPVPAGQNLSMYPARDLPMQPASLRRSGSGNLRMYTGGAQNSGAREMTLR